MCSIPLSPFKQGTTKNGLTKQLLTPFFGRLKICLSWAVLIEGHLFLWMASWKKKNGAILILINLVENGSRKSLDDLFTLNGRHFRLSRYFRRNLQQISQKIKGSTYSFTHNFFSKYSPFNNNFPLNIFFYRKLLWYPNTYTERPLMTKTIYMHTKTSGEKLYNHNNKTQYLASTH